MTRRTFQALSLGLLVCAAACASACGAAPAPPARSVPLRLKGTPPHATVTVDDIHVGPLEVVQRRGIGLPPGPHRVTVEAPGYFPFDKLVTADQAAVVLEVALVPVPE